MFRKSWYKQSKKCICKCSRGFQLLKKMFLISLPRFLRENAHTIRLLCAWNMFYRKATYTNIRRTTNLNTKVARKFFRPVPSEDHGSSNSFFDIRKLIATYKTSYILWFSSLSLDDSTSDKRVSNFIAGYLRKETKFRAESYLSLPSRKI